MLRLHQQTESVLTPISGNNQACWDASEAGSDAVGALLTVITAIDVNSSWLHRNALQRLQFDLTKF